MKLKIKALLIFVIFIVKITYSQEIGIKIGSNSDIYKSSSSNQYIKPHATVGLENLQVYYLHTLNEHLKLETGLSFKYYMYSINYTTTNTKGYYTFDHNWGVPINLNYEIQLKKLKAYFYSGISIVFNENNSTTEITSQKDGYPVSYQTKINFSSEALGLSVNNGLGCKYQFSNWSVGIGMEFVHYLSNYYTFKTEIMNLQSGEIQLFESTSTGDYLGFYLTLSKSFSFNK